MRLLSQHDTPKTIEHMRKRWKKGKITTREYHEFIEKEKHSLAHAERVYRFF